MNEVEAQELLATKLEEWRKRPYVELAALAESTSATGEIPGANDILYQVEIQVFWDGRSGGDVRVIGAIDDGGMRAYSALTDSFIMAPDGSFIGE